MEFFEQGIYVFNGKNAGAVHPQNPKNPAWQSGTLQLYRFESVHIYEALYQPTLRQGQLRA